MPECGSELRASSAGIRDCGLNRGFGRLECVGEDQAADGIPVGRRLGAHLGQQAVARERPPRADDRLVSRRGDCVGLARHGGKREPLAERVAPEACVAEPASARERGGPQLRVHAPGIDEICLELQGQFPICVAQLVRTLLEYRDSVLHLTAVEQGHCKLARDLDTLAHVGRRRERRPEMLLGPGLVLRHLGLPE